MQNIFRPENMKYKGLYVFELQVAEFATWFYWFLNRSP